MTCTHVYTLFRTGQQPPMRDPQWLTPEFAAELRAAGATYCLASPKWSRSVACCTG